MEPLATEPLVVLTSASPIVGELLGENRIVAFHSATGVTMCRMLATLTECASGPRRQSLRGVSAGQIEAQHATRAGSGLRVQPSQALSQERNAISNTQHYGEKNLSAIGELGAIIRPAPRGHTMRARWPTHENFERARRSRHDGGGPETRGAVLSATTTAAHPRNQRLSARCPAPSVSGASGSSRATGPVHLSEIQHSATPHRALVRPPPRTTASQRVSREPLVGCTD